MNKLDAQRKIMGVLKEDLKNKIHALEIKIIFNFTIIFLAH